MATCKDCLHVEMCYRIQVEGIPKCTDTEHCKEFKDRNRFVELPCKAGDTLYEICLRKKGGKWKPAIVERTVQCIEVGSSGCSIVRCGKTIVLFSCDFGRIVQLAREEAEQALKGREKC